jgi:putative phosphoesterase
MLVGIIADVHGNLAAFEAVLGELGKLGPRKILCAGDLVGYYPFPDEVIALARKNRVHSIAGNHERAVLGSDFSGLNDLAAATALWTAGRLTPASRETICRLPDRNRLELGGRRFLLVHGSPRDDDEYVFPLTADLWPFRDLDVDILVMGHTHVQWKGRFGGLVAVNPGSVGQPRDRDPRAAFATIETEDLSVGLHRVDYDIRRTADAVAACGFPARLAQRLYAGR